MNNIATTKADVRYRFYRRNKAILNNNPTILTPDFAVQNLIGKNDQPA